MEKFNVVEFGEEHLASAGGMLAARHSAERRVFPLLPKPYEDPAEALTVVRAALGYGEGVAAVDGAGGLAGFLFAIRNMTEPTAARARFSALRETWFLAHAHAVEPGREPFAVYHSLYAALAERMVGDGIFEHVAHVPAGAAGVIDAWYSLGFGKANMVGMRDLRPLAEARAGAFELREATEEDIDTVQGLVDEEAKFHATSPIFRPYVAGQTHAAVREALLESLRGTESTHLIARVGGVDAGIIEVGPGRESPLYMPEGGAYIGDTAVRAEYRGSGVGAALVEGALARARERGYRAVTLHFAAANDLSTAFWTGLGFVVAMMHLRRRVDERMATWRP